MRADISDVYNCVGLSDHEYKHHSMGSIIWSCIECTSRVAGTRVLFVCALMNNLVVIRQRDFMQLRQAFEALECREMEYHLTLQWIGIKLLRMMSFKSLGKNKHRHFLCGPRLNYKVQADQSLLVYSERLFPYEIISLANDSFSW